MKIAWAPFAHPDAPQGYGIISSKLREALQLAGAQVLPSTEFGWDCAIAVSLPAAWPFPGDAFRMDLVWHTMFELEPLPKEWVGPLNHCGLVWVPTTWCRDLFIDAGVKAPIMVAGYGVDPTTYFPTDRTLRLESEAPMKFLAWGTALVGRKNIMRTIQAFLNADLPKDKAVLQIKLNAGTSASYVADGKGGAHENITVIAEDWRYHSDIADWLRSGDCLIYLSAGEGFGLQPFEAMATGLPVICANNTGMRDYLAPDRAYLVETIGKEASPGYDIRFSGKYQQCLVDTDQATEWIRYVYNNRAAAYGVGEKAAMYTQKRTWEAAGHVILQDLRAHYG